MRESERARKKDCWMATAPLNSTSFTLTQRGSEEKREKKSGSSSFPPVLPPNVPLMDRFEQRGGLRETAQAEAWHAELAISL